jgi:hypothetical protein
MNRGLGLALLFWTLGLGASAFGQEWADTPYETEVAHIKAVQAAHADKVALFVLGKNDQGDDILGLRIGQEGAGALPFLVVATHHGDEGQVVDVTNAMIDDLVAAAPANAVYYVIPVLNISGYNADRREESFRGGGTVDANRDYPDPCRGTDAPFQLYSTKALADFVAAKNIVAAVTLHGYNGSLTYPWGTYTTEPLTPDNATFAPLVEQAAQVSGYQTGTHGQILYPTVGAFEDWAYYEYGVWVTLLEMSDGADPARDAKSLETYFANVPHARSAHHEHTGQCTGHYGVVLGRP